MNDLVERFKNWKFSGSNSDEYVLPLHIFRNAACVGATLLSLISAAVVGVVYSFSFRKYPVLKNGVVVLTGCSTGIGFFAAEYLARHTNYVVFATVRKPGDVDKLMELNIPNLKSLQMDVTDHASCVRATEAVKEFLDSNQLPLVAIVNNAGINAMFPAEFHPLSHVKQIFEVNFFGPVRLLQLFLPLLRENKGSRIVMISSFVRSFPVPNGSIYSASKCALEGFSDAIRRELSPFDVSVSSIEPGFVCSQMNVKNSELTDKLLSDARQNTKMKDIYHFLFSSEEKSRFCQCVNKSDNPLCVIKAILHAIEQPYPQTKYYVANYRGIGIQCFSWVLWLFNDRLQDKLLASFTKPTRTMFGWKL
jgi:NAD(P)-dependent dehydrogenase (short-subunit alcohol dehydrogenase family)